MLRIALNRLQIISKNRNINETEISLIVVLSRPLRALPAAAVCDAWLLIPLTR